MKTVKQLILLFLVLAYQSISAFTFTLSGTDETCPGNGSITFNVGNQIPNSTLNFLIFKLPETTVPYASQSSMVLNGLTAGEYLVIATETGNNQTTTQQANIIINNTYSPLSFSVQYVNQSCSEVSNVELIVNSGIAVGYEIISGPVTFPQQTSPNFSNLPIGTYTIRAIDICGTAVVTTFTVSLAASGLSIGNPVLSNTSPPSCNFSVISNTITPIANTVIAYPLTVIYTIFPPDGSPSYTINQPVNSGNDTSHTLSITLPNFNFDEIDYQISITDDCGTTYTDDFTANITNSVSVSLTKLPCDTNFFTINTGNFITPLTVVFNDAPPGFIPENFNSIYPNPFNVSSITFGSESNLVPIGDYSFTITDACGRNQTLNFSVTLNTIEPDIFTGNNGCNTNDGYIEIDLPFNAIAQALIIVAPSNYPFPLPHDVSEFIVDGRIVVNPVPIGDYEIEVIDECGITYEVADIVVPIYEDKGLASDLRVGCEINRASLRLSSRNGKIANTIITSAPSDFQESIPFNANAYITTNGLLYINNLPPGDYIFSVVDECGFTNTLERTVIGYEIESSTFTPIFNCGSFDINLDFISNGTIGQSYWLQKLIDSSTDTWGHPATNVVYNPSSFPTANNSIQLTNNSINFNFTYNGVFRIVRKFNSHNDGIAINSGSSVTKYCIELLSPTFEFNQALEVLEINRSPCTDLGFLDVIINAIGVAPITYKLIQKDGEIINIDNGTSNIFYDLPIGLYTLEVEDACGNKQTKVFDVATLESIIQSTQPENLLLCATNLTNNETFDLTAQIPTMVEEDLIPNYTFSFHTSLTDAQQNNNPIPNPSNYNPLNNPQSIFVRIVFNLIPSCYDVETFDIFAAETPSIPLNNNYLHCDEGPFTIEITNPSPDTVYTWSDGSVGTSFTTSTLGTTEIEVTGTTTFPAYNFECINSKIITLYISNPPEIENIETVDWTENQNSITVTTNNVGFFEFSIDNSTWQESNTFNNLLPGVYTVYVRDTIGCGEIAETVWLLYYRKFFTPNGDGYNDTWFIENSNLEEDFIVHIFDRYGKLLKVFNSKSEGWDGNFNGSPQFSTDYWFMIFRRDGRVHRGHFSMKR